MPAHPASSSQPSDDYRATIMALRAEKDTFFGVSPDSPIPARERGADFGGLRYYPPDPAFRVEAEVVPFADPQTVPLGSTKGDVRPQVRYAELRFILGGEACRLLAFTDPGAADHGELFVPFRDTTSGSETYGAGRYLETAEQDRPDGTRYAELDFNLAYSPWCAYNPAYSCTLPPPENRLAVPVHAGERSYSEDH